MNENIKQIFFEMTGKEVRSVEKLEQGITNENYLINNSLVLRLVRKDCDPSIDRKTEKYVYEKIEPLNISEKLYTFDEKSGTKVTKFVHGSRFYNQKPTIEQITYVAKSLKKLHSMQLDIKKGYDIYKKLALYKNYVDEKDYLDPKYEKLVIREAKEIEKNEPIVLSHNDLVKGNLLFKYNGLTIIDWEYASMNYELFDLASFISENNLSPELEDFFLKKYYGYKYTKLKKKRVDNYSRLLDVLFYYRALFYYKKREERIYFDIAVEKFQRIKNNIMEIKNFY